jgi:hypothetical protein
MWRGLLFLFWIILKCLGGCDRDFLSVLSGASFYLMCKLIQKIFFVCRFRDGRVRWLVYKHSLPLMTSLACPFTFERAVCLWQADFAGFWGFGRGWGWKSLTWVGVTHSVNDPLVFGRFVLFYC